MRGQQQQRRQVERERTAGRQVSGKAESDQCQAVLPSGRLCLQVQDLSLFKQIDDIYSERITSIERCSASNETLVKTLKEWICDLTSIKNELITVVKSVESEAVKRIKSLKSRYNTLVIKNEKLCEDLKLKDNQIKCFEENKHKLTEQLEECKMKNDQLNEDIGNCKSSMNQSRQNEAKIFEMEYCIKKLNMELDSNRKAVVKKENQIIQLEQELCELKKKIRQLECAPAEYDESSRRKIADLESKLKCASWELSKRQSSQMSSVCDDVSRLKTSQQEFSEMSFENKCTSTPVNQLGVLEFEEKINCLNKLLEDQKEKEAMHETELMQLRNRLDTLKASSREMQEALTLEVAEKHDSLVSLRREMAQLEEQMRKSDMQTQFKDDIIKGLRKEVKIARAKESFVEMLGLNGSSRVQMKSEIDSLRAELEERASEVASLEMKLASSQSSRLEAELATVKSHLEERDRDLLAMCNKLDYIKRYIEKLMIDEDLSIKCGMEALLHELSEDSEWRRKARRSVTSLSDQPPDSVIIINRSYSLPTDTSQCLPHYQTGRNNVTDGLKNNTELQEAKDEICSLRKLLQERDAELKALNTSSKWYTLPDASLSVKFEEFQSSLESSFKKVENAVDSLKESDVGHLVYHDVEEIKDYLTKEQSSLESMTSSLQNLLCSINSVHKGSEKDDFSEVLNSKLNDSLKILRSLKDDAPQQEDSNNPKYSADSVAIIKSIQGLVKNCLTEAKCHENKFTALMDMLKTEGKNFQCQINDIDKLISENKKANCNMKQELKMAICETSIAAEQVKRTTEKLSYLKNAITGIQDMVQCSLKSKESLNDLKEMVNKLVQTFQEIVESSSMQEDKCDNAGKGKNLSGRQCKSTPQLMCEMSERILSIEGQVENALDRIVQSRQLISEHSERNNCEAAVCLEDINQNLIKLLQCLGFHMRSNRQKLVHLDNAVMKSRKNLLVKLEELNCTTADINEVIGDLNVTGTLDQMKAIPQDSEEAPPICWTADGEESIMSSRGEFTMEELVSQIKTLKSSLRTYKDTIHQYEDQISRINSEVARRDFETCEAIELIAADKERVESESKRTVTELQAQVTELQTALQKNQIASKNMNDMQCLLQKKEQRVTCQEHQITLLEQKVMELHDTLTQLENESKREACSANRCAQRQRAIENADPQEENKRLKCDLMNLRSLIGEQEVELNDLKMQLNNKCEQIEEMKNQFSCEINKMARLADDLKCAIRDRDSKIEELCVCLDENNLQISLLIKENQEKDQNNQVKIKSVEAEKNRLASCNNILMEQIECMKCQLQESGADSAQTEQIKRNYMELQDKYHCLVQLYQRSRCEIKLLDESICDLMNKADSNNHELENREAELNQINRELCASMKETNTLKHKEKCLREKLDKEREQYRARICEMCRESELLEETIKCLREEIDKLNQNNADIGRNQSIDLERELIEKTKEVEEMKAYVNGLKCENESLRERLKCSMMMNDDDCNRDNDSNLDNECGSRLSSSHQNLKESERKIKHLAEENELLLNQIDSLREETFASKREADATKCKLTEAMQEIKSLQKRYNKINEEFKAFRNEYDRELYDLMTENRTLNDKLIRCNENIKRLEFDLKKAKEKYLCSTRSEAQLQELFTKKDESWTQKYKALCQEKLDLLDEIEALKAEINGADSQDLTSCSGGTKSKMQSIKHRLEQKECEVLYLRNQLEISEEDKYDLKQMLCKAKSNMESLKKRYDRIKCSEQSYRIENERLHEQMENNTRLNPESRDSARNRVEQQRLDHHESNMQECQSSPRECHSVRECEDTVGRNTKDEPTCNTR